MIKKFLLTLALAGLVISSGSFELDQPDTTTSPNYMMVGGHHTIGD